MAKLIDDAILFAIHEGTTAFGSRIGLFWDHHCLPISTMVKGMSGLEDLWDSTKRVEEFFSAIGFPPDCNWGSMKSDEPPNGLWVYEVTFDSDVVSDDLEDWSHLTGGDFRRPHADELARIADGLPAWPDGTLL